MSRIIPIDEITDGQVLGDAVNNNFGQTLIPAGAALQKRHIALLKTWSIPNVTIKNSDEDSNEEISEDLMEMSRQALQKRINWKPRNGNEEDLIEMATLTTAKLISNY